MFRYPFISIVAEADFVEDGGIVQEHEKERTLSVLAWEELPTLTQMVRKYPGTSSEDEQLEILLRYDQAVAPRARELHDALTAVYEHGTPANQSEAVRVSERALWGNCSCRGYITARKQWPSARRENDNFFSPVTVAVVEMLASGYLLLDIM